MALDKATLVTQLKTAFGMDDWSKCADQIGIAIDSFIKTGEASTDVTATVTPPFPTPPYQAVGKGKGHLLTSGLSALQSTIKAKFLATSTTWADLGPIIGNAIDSDVKTATVTTDVNPTHGGILLGTGIGPAGCVDTSATLSALIADLTDAFVSSTYNQSWDSIAEKIADSINTYITGAIVTTTDTGTTPPISWAGTGTGSVV